MDSYMICIADSNLITNLTIDQVIKILEDLAWNDLDEFWNCKVYDLKLGWIYASVWMEEVPGLDAGRI
ncbi:MAG: hypothetical protein Q8940_17705 [Bacteroidota bacterium]|nr:hypothetical protein [Bacteroidota bacterium]